MLSSQPVFAWFSASAFKKLRRLGPTYLWPFLHSPWERKGLSFISLLSQAMGVSTCFISSSSQEWYLHSPFPRGYENRVAIEDGMIFVRKNEGFINFIVSHCVPLIMEKAHGGDSRAGASISSFLCPFLPSILQWQLYSCPLSVQCPYKLLTFFKLNNSDKLAHRHSVFDVSPPLGELQRTNTWAKAMNH